MAGWLGWATVCLLLIVGVSCENEHWLKYDSCVVGGGGGGGYTAASLHKLGDSVALLEKRHKIGGACNTFYFHDAEGRPGAIDAGVGVFPDTAYAAQHGCPRWGEFDMRAKLEELAGPDTIAVQPFLNLTAFLGDYGTGFFDPYPVSAPPFTEPEREAFARLHEIVTDEFGWADIADYPDNVPEQLRQSYADWLVLRNLTILIPVYLNTQIYYGGYPQFDLVSALYPLIETACTDLLFHTDPYSWMSLPGGCDLIYKGIERLLGRENVYTSTDILSIDRSCHGQKHGIKIVASQKDTLLHLECSRLVIAIPPTLDNLAFLDLSADERELFQYVDYFDYFDGIVNATGTLEQLKVKWDLTNVNLSNPPLFQPSSPFLHGILMNCEPPTGGPALLTGFSQEHITQHQTKEIIEQQLMGVSPEALTDIRLLRHDLHQFVAHFTRLDNHPYKKLRELQGQLGTVYVGSINGAGNHAVIWYNVDKIIRQHLPPL